MRYTLTKSMVDPFVDISQLNDGVWSFIARSPGRGGDARTYLVCGRDAALVIDTGFGIGNLLGLIRTFTDLPLSVVNTHFHGDHTGGNPQFGSVYIHEQDAPILQESLSRPPRPMKIAKDTFFTADDLIPRTPYEIIPIPTGYTFDLGGGHVVEVLHTPGHSAGGISLLEKKRRMLFTGDAIVYTPTYLFGPVPEGEKPKPYTTVEEFRDSLLVLRERKGEFDGLFPGHHNMNLSPDYVDDMITCCEEIMADPSGFTEIMEPMPGKNVKVRYVNGACIAFCEERVFKG